MLYLACGKICAKYKKNIDTKSPIENSVRKYFSRVLIIMKKVTLCTLLSAIVILSLNTYNKRIYCRDLQTIFDDKIYNIEGLRMAMDHDPDENTFFFPSLEKKNFFESIDDLSICRRRDVRKFIYIYLTRGRKYTKRAIMRSYLYLNTIDTVFDDYPEIPKDIALLPLLESGFNPYAVSRTRAVGLWQFMKATSKIVGLKTNRWLDERRAIEKSTKAAIYHLTNLNSFLNSWELTLAAYNGGGNYIKRAMMKTGEKDFWKLRKTKFLNRETREYVSRFAALLLIYKNQGLFKIKDEIEPGVELDIEKIVLKSPLNIRNISKITGVPLSIIKKLNPELKRNVIPPYLNEYSFTLPVNALEKIRQNKSKHIKIRFI